MGKWRTYTEEWLSSEQRGLDAAADAAFALVSAALPVAYPSTGFVENVTFAAWQARARRSQAAIATGIAASLLLAGMAGAVAYGLFGVASAWLLTTGTAGAASSTLVTAAAAATVMDWWAAGAHIGRAIGTAMAVPQGAAILAVVELVGAGALYLLHRLLRSDVRLRGTAHVCV